MPEGKAPWFLIADGEEDCMERMPPRIFEGDGSAWDTIACCRISKTCTPPVAATATPLPRPCTTSTWWCSGTSTWGCRLGTYWSRRFREHTENYLIFPHCFRVVWVHQSVSNDYRALILASISQPNPRPWSDNLGGTITEARRCTGAKPGFNAKIKGCQETLFKTEFGKVHWLGLVIWWCLLLCNWSVKCSRKNSGGDPSPNDFCFVKWFFQFVYVYDPNNHEVTGPC